MSESLTNILNSIKDHIKEESDKHYANPSIGRALDDFGSGERKVCFKKFHIDELKANLIEVSELDLSSHDWHCIGVHVTKLCNLLYITILAGTLLFFCNCKGNEKNSDEQAQNPLNVVDTVVRPGYVEYHPHLDSIPDHLWKTSVSYKGERSAPLEEVPQPKNSKEYDEGYDQGFDDGEQDAIDRNGFESSYDESCKYKGRKKRDYEDGYDEGYYDGYESGKYDSEEDGDDEEYDDY